MTRAVLPILAGLACLTASAAQAQAQAYDCLIETFCENIDTCEPGPNVLLPLVRLADGGYRLDGVGQPISGDAPGNFGAPVIHFLDATQNRLSFMVTMDQTGGLVVSGQRINETGAAEVMSAKGHCEAAE